MQPLGCPGTDAGRRRPAAAPPGGERFSPALLLLPLLAAAACGTPPAPAAETSTPLAAPARPAPEPWPATFGEPALLVADRIQVEGPRGLLEHFAARVEPAVHERVEKTLPAGYLQRITVRPDSAQAEIRAWLDGLEIVALESLTALERPGEVELFVLAEGDAFWRETGSGRERRGQRLRLEAEGAPR